MSNRHLSGLTALSCLLALGGALQACGGNEGLTAQGFFRVDDSVRDIHTDIDLAEESRIDSGGRVTGSCEIRDIDGVRSVAIDLYTDGGGADNQLNRASITGVAGAATVGLTATVGSTTYSRGDCAASINAIDRNGTAVVSTSGACTLTTSGTDSFEANVDLAVFGCRVVTD